MKIIDAHAPAAIESVADVLDAGGVAVIPTETVYGVCVRWDRQESVESIFKLKSRSHDKPLQVLVSDVDLALALGEFNDEAVHAVEEGWPGPLTVVVPRSPRSRGIYLGGDGSTIGLRVPDHDLARHLLTRAGPLAATSANPAGVPTGATIQQIARQLGDGVSIYLDAGTIEGRPSRVVSFVEGQTELRSR